MRDVEDDNLLLRNIHAGIANSHGMPNIIFDGLNALEICLMEAGIFKRKYIDLETRAILPRNIHVGPLYVQRNLARCDMSRIHTEGHLDNNLYGIILHLLTAINVARIYSRYKKEWDEAQASQIPSDE